MANIRLPQVISVLDYHDFRDIRNTMAMFDLKVKHVELGLLDGMYVGIIYQNRCPSFKKQKELVSQQLGKTAWDEIE